MATQPTTDDLATALAYLEQRVAHMQYPQFQAAGWPIGSGIVESANKLVVEDRLKGAGMHSHKIPLANLPISSFLRITLGKHALIVYRTRRSRCGEPPCC